MTDPRIETFRSGAHALVYDSGGTAETPTFVLIHGIGMGRAVYADLAAELRRQGSVYVIDLPGFGESPEPDEPLTIPQTGDLIAEFIGELGLERPVLVGHSMGGQVTAEVLARHPGLADRAVLISPAVNRAERSALRQALRMAQDLAGESPKVLAMGTVQYAKAGPRWFFRKAQQMLIHRLEDICPQIRAEVLVLRGEKDRVCPRGWVQEIAELIPHSIYQEIPDRGHEAMISSAQPAADLILAHARGAESGSSPN